MNDAIKISGNVIIQELVDGKVISQIEGDNMVLAAGILNVERLLGGHVDGKRLTKIGVGTSGTPVDAADTALTGAVIKPVTTVSYLAGNVVSFTATLDAGDPAMTIQEVGIYNENDVLCHRKVFDPPKDKEVGLSYRIIYNIKVR